jgi:ABC-type lipoprotein release transport system permease subunit
MKYDYYSHKSPQLKVGDKVVAYIPTTSHLMKKARKIVKVLDIITIQDYSSDDTIFYTAIQTAKYGVVPASQVLQIL